MKSTWTGQKSSLNGGWRPELRRGVALVLALSSSALMAPSTSYAWSADGHRRVARSASGLAVATAADMPEFFRRGSEQIADSAVDPDVRRLRSTPQLRSREHPEHYLDWELVDGELLPDSRYEFLDLVERGGLSVSGVGTVPYAVIEATQYLAIAFAEHRHRPEDEFLRAKVLHLAGVLAHYSADMSQPLHTTIHHNGRARADNSSPGTGIHHRVDSLFGRVQTALAPGPDTGWPTAFPQVWPAVLHQLEKSHRLVDRVYELEDDLAWDEGGEAGAEVPRAVRDFAAERFTDSVLFTARLFASAWESSATLELPKWRFESSQLPVR